MRILIVDDERSYGSLLASCCKKLGHRTRLADSVAAAIELLERESFDALFADLAMPEEGGLELAARLRARGNQLPVAFCTGTAGDDDAAAASALGPVLPKVWTVADVRSALQRLREAGRAEERPIAPRLAQGSIPLAPAAQRPRAAGSGTSHVIVPRGTRAPAPPRSVPRGSVHLALERVRVRCRSWDRLHRLCDERLAGHRSITVRVRQALSVGGPVEVVLELPDEMTVVVRGIVVAAGARAGERCEYRVDLVGFDADYARRLIALAESHGATPVPARATTDSSDTL